MKFARTIQCQGLALRQRVSSERSKLVLFRAFSTSTVEPSGGAVAGQYKQLILGRNGEFAGFAKPNMPDSANCGIADDDVRQFFLDFSNFTDKSDTTGFHKSLRRNLFVYGSLTPRQLDCVKGPIAAYTRRGPTRLARKTFVYSDPVLVKLLTVTDADWEQAKLLKTGKDESFVDSDKQKADSLKAFLMEKHFLTEKQFAFAANLMYDYFIGDPQPKPQLLGQQSE